jgi:hypothetical protein
MIEGRECIIAIGRRLLAPPPAPTFSSVIRPVRPTSGTAHYLVYKKKTSKIIFTEVAQCSSTPLA